MLSITIPSARFYNEDTGEFIYKSAVTLKLEHSLLSVRRWESKWHKSFLDISSKGMTMEENMDYIRCMSIDQNVEAETIQRMTRKNYEDIIAYMNDPMTATTVKDIKNRGPQKIITAEVLYAIMIEHGIPFECEKWHLNQLLMLIRVCSARNTPAKKQSKAETAAYYDALNNARRKMTGSRG